MTQEFENALELIANKLTSNIETGINDWEVIFKEIVGNSDAQTIENIYKFVEENFSFKIADGAEGFFYFGKMDASGDIATYQAVDGMVKTSDGAIGYISSTDAGKLFNDTGFETP